MKSLNCGIRDAGGCISIHLCNSDVRIISAHAIHPKILQMQSCEPKCSIKEIFNFNLFVLVRKEKAERQLGCGCMLIEKSICLNKIKRMHNVIQGVREFKIKGKKSYFYSNFYFYSETPL